MDLDTLGVLTEDNSLEKDFINSVHVTSVPLDKTPITSKRKKSISNENNPKKIKITPPGSTLLPPKRKIICYSGCNKEEIEELNKLLISLGHSEYQTDIDDTTTHVVLGSKVRTLKTIVAISRGVCIVRKEWMIESQKANRWLKEEDFDVDEWFPGAKESQRAHETHTSNLLFSSMTFYIGNNMIFPKNTLQKVLESLGGKVNFEPEGVKIRIEGTLKGLRENQSSKIVTESWVFDSLVAWKILNVNDYQPK